MMDFPSPSTADQFFDEEQWEFQRWLGEFTVEDTLDQLRRYCDERIKAGGISEKKIESLKDQMKLAEGCLERQTLDYDLFWPRNRVYSTRS
jgi:hypothetical protein